MNYFTLIHRTCLVGTIGALLCICSPISSYAQVTMRSDLSSSEMSVKGTSTLHDWESTVDVFEASAQVDGNSLKNVAFKAQVESIKSGKSGMDKNTYKALMSDKYPEILFSADDLKMSGSEITGTGRLTIASTTQSIPVNLSFETWAEGTYTIFGNIDLKMTDYGIDPPRAMMGTVRTGDDITISFELSMTTN